MFYNGSTHYRHRISGPDADPRTQEYFNNNPGLAIAIGLIICIILSIAHHDPFSSMILPIGLVVVLIAGWRNKCKKEKAAREAKVKSYKKIG